MGAETGAFVTRGGGGKNVLLDVTCGGGGRKELLAGGCVAAPVIGS